MSRAMAIFNMRVYDYIRGYHQLIRFHCGFFSLLAAKCGGSSRTGGGVDGITST